MIDMSATDCPPCQLMAQGEKQFVANMAAQGIDVEVITLLAPSLDDVFGETTTTVLNNWVSKYALESPVLGDRAWGQSVFSPPAKSAGYPSWVLVAPDLTVFEYGQGWGEWADVETLFVAHKNGN